MTPTDEKPMTVDALEAIAREVGQVERRHCIGKAQGFDVRDAYSELRAAIEQYGREQAYGDAYQGARQDLLMWKRRALAAEQRGSGEPVAMLHDDGHWTHPPGRDPLDRFSGKVRMEVYAAPQSREPLTEEQIDRHTLLAQECPPGSKVILVSSLRRLRAHGIRSAG